MNGKSLVWRKRKASQDVRTKIKHKSLTDSDISRKIIVEIDDISVHKFHPMGTVSVCKVFGKKCLKHA